MQKLLIMGAQWGSEGKGAIAGYVAKRMRPTAAVAAFPPSTGHTFVHSDGRRVMNMQLPISVVAPSVEQVFIGPGALLDPEVLLRECRECGVPLDKLVIHANAAIVDKRYADQEREAGLTKIGSTVKGGMAAEIARMSRNLVDSNVASNRLKGTVLEDRVFDPLRYSFAIDSHDDVIIEGSQGFSLSMYHGQYPYTTARDTTPAYVMSACGIPWRWVNDIDTVLVARTFPIRVNNRDGSSGPCYSDQYETTFDAIKQKTEYTTVTKLPRRIFTFSELQMYHAAMLCGQRKNDTIALMFGDYIDSFDKLTKMIEHLRVNTLMRVSMVCFGPNENDIVEDRNFHDMLFEKWTESRHRLLTGDDHAA